MQLQEIAERCQQGDREAFAQLYTAMRQPLRAVCLRYVHDEAVADDLLHDAFLLIYLKISELKDTRRIEAWMNMVARRMALLYLRQQRQHHQVPLSSCSATSLQSLTVENGAESSLALSEILAVVDSLPEGYRHVFRLSVLEDMTHQEIAALLHIGPHSSSSQLARAKRKLQQIIKKYWVVPLLILTPTIVWLLRPKGIPPSVCPPSVNEREPRFDSETAEAEPKSQGAAIPLPSRGGAGVGSVTPSQQSELTNNIDPTPKPDFAPPSLRSPIAPSSQLPTREGNGCAETESPINNLTDDINNGNDLRNNSLELSTESLELSIESLESLENLELSDGSSWMTSLTYNGQWPMVNGQSSMQLPYADAETNPMVRDSISRHHIPLTVALSVGYRLDRHWQVGTGLSYTRLTSDFCSGNSYVSMQQHQTVQYLGIPVSIAYHSPLTSHLSLLTSASTTLHLPLNSTLESHYLLPDGTIAEPSTQSLQPDLQWSVGLGVGMQYELTPHVDLFVQPSLEHYFKNNSSVSTWNTEHPFVFSVPFGIIISF